MRNLRLIALNEFNFDVLDSLPEKQAKLANLRRIYKAAIETEAEVDGDELEPWIQWVTIHAGLEFEQHKVFRLGDQSVKYPDQIWEVLEQQGYSVNAIAPMNAINRTRRASLWLPDPWTVTRSSGPLGLRKFYECLGGAVKSNSEKVPLCALAGIAIFWLFFMRWAYKLKFLALGIGILKGKVWNKALIFDLILWEIFLSTNKSMRPDFASVFLNGAAHIQHHFLKCAKHLKTDEDWDIPAWYSGARGDPILEMLEFYDWIIGSIDIENCGRIIIATGLSQEPTKKSDFYWRVRDLDRFLKRKLAIKYESAQQTMSRDFWIHFDNKNNADLGIKKLLDISVRIGEKSMKLFSLKDTGDLSVFVTLTYPNDLHDPSAQFVSSHDNAIDSGDFSFIALKNGRHRRLGWLYDSEKKAVSSLNSSNVIEVKYIYSIMLDHFSVDHALDDTSEKY